jgi:2'-5' RNA ligase
VTRLFVAAWPPPSVRESVTALPHDGCPGVRWIRPGNLHVTLSFLGEADSSEATERLTALPHDAVIASVGPAVDLLGRVVMAPVDGLESLAGTVASSLHGVGTSPTARPFVGHLTLGRLRRDGPVALVGHPVEAAFAVDEVTLVSSSRGSDGSAYEVLASFALGR